MRLIGCIGFFLCGCASGAVPSRHYEYRNSPTSRVAYAERPMVVTNPSQSYSAFLTIAESYTVAQITTDIAGNTYVAGSRIFPLAVNAPGQGTTNDVLIAKLDLAGNTVFTVTMSGKGTDQALAIAVDPVGNIYVGGNTTSTNFPLRAPLQSAGGCAGPCSTTTGFITKLSPDGSQMIYSTYFGGTRGASSVTAIAVDAAGNAYVGGTTESPNYPHTNGLPAGATSSGLPEVFGAFFAKISPQGTSLLYSGVIAGQTLACSGGSSCFLRSRSTSLTSLALDSTNNLYLAGNTTTTDLPGTSASFLAKGLGPFVAKINPAGSALLALTYLSPNQAFGGLGISLSTLTGMTVSPEGDVFLAGSTSDPTFPVTPGALQLLLNQNGAPSLTTNPSDGFVAKMTPDLSRITWATYLGGTAGDVAQAIALDASGLIWISGLAVSSDFPNSNGWTSGQDFLVALTGSGSALTYSALFPRGSVSASLVASSAGALYTSGSSGLVSASVNTARMNAGNVFLIQNAVGQTRTQLAAGEIISIFGQNIGSPAGTAAAPGSDGFYPFTLGGVQVYVNGVLAPLLFVSPNQINAVVPLKSTGTTASVVVANQSGKTAPFVASLVPAVPGVFRIDPAHAVALDQDGTLNSATNPASAGSVVAIWLTGVGAIDQTLRDGQVQTKATPTGCCNVTVLGQSVDVLYSGDAPGSITGLTQLNLRIPTDYLSHAVYFAISDSTAFDTFLIYVK